MLEELIEIPQWVVRRSDKIPLQSANGEKASVTNSQHWSSFSAALACVKADSSLGLGFVITKDCPFSFIDLDDPKGDADIIKTQTKIYNAFDSYTERSPSGKGVHIIVRGKVPTNKKKPKIEVYSHDRYMTITGDMVRGPAIKEDQELLTQLWQEMGGLESSLEEIIDDEPQTKTDEEVIAEAKAASNGQLFEDLWAARWDKYPERYPSASEADLALISIIAFYTDNKPQAVRIFRSSKLGSRTKIRGKKDNHFYNLRWGLVTKAFDQKGAHRGVEDLAAAVAVQMAEIQAAKAAEPPPTIKPAPELPDIQDNTVSIEFPSGVVGEIAEYIYANAINPVKEVAIAAALAWFAGLIGRAYNYSNTGLNQYIILLAHSGGGKDAAGSGMDKLTQAVSSNGGPMIDKHIGPGVISSPQALLAYLQESDCFLSHISEIGHWMQKICHKNARDNEKILRSVLLQLFDKSGSLQSVKPVIFADKAKNSKAIDAPAFSMFGDSTPSEFYKALDENNVAEGLVSRLTIIECPKHRPTFKKDANKLPVPQLLIGVLVKYLQVSMQAVQPDMITHISQTEEAEAYHLELQQKFADLHYADTESPVAPIWNRAHLRILRIAGLLAAGDSREYPTVSIDNIKWAENLVMKSILCVVNRFEDGRIGEGNLQNDQNQLMANKLIQYFNSKFTPAMEKNYSITKEMHDLKIVTYRYLQSNMVKNACFRNDRNSIDAFKKIVQMYIQIGHLEKLDLTKLKAGARGGEAFYIKDLNGLKSKTT